MSFYPIVLSQTSFVHHSSLTFPFEERGLQFGDGVYEVIKIYDGAYYLLEKHIERLFRSIEAIKIKPPFSKEDCKQLLLDLLAQNNMTKDGKVYLQITRGSAPREHIFPVDTLANFYAYIDAAPRPIQKLNNGVDVITYEDARWDYCYIKSLNLLPNVLAKQTAYEQGCHEAILHKDGLVTECSSSNAYLVKDGEIYTHPTTKSILYGCVRMRVEQFAKDLKIPFIEKPFTLDDIIEADEIFLSSSTSEVMPVVSVDGKQVANGKPGPLTIKLQRAYENDANIMSAFEIETNMK